MNPVYPADRDGPSRFVVHGVTAPQHDMRFMAGGNEYRIIGEPVRQEFRQWTARCQLIRPGHRYDSAPFSAVISCRP
jgi:hypothetical protein